MKEYHYLHVNFHLDPNTDPYRMEIYVDSDQNIRDILRAFINLDDSAWSVMDGAGNIVDKMTGDSLRSWTPLHVVSGHTKASLSPPENGVESHQSLDIRYFPPFNLSTPEIRRQEIFIDLEKIPGRIDQWVSAGFTPDGRIWLMGERRIYCIDIFENQFSLHGAGLDLPYGFSGNGLLSYKDLLLIYDHQACFSLSMQTFIETAGTAVRWAEFYRPETGQILEVQQSFHGVQILCRKQSTLSCAENVDGHWRENFEFTISGNLKSSVLQGMGLIWADHLGEVFTNEKSSLFLSHPGKDHEPLQLKQLPNRDLMLLRGSWIHVISHDREDKLELKYRFYIPRPITISLEKNVLTILRSDNKIHLMLLSQENFMPTPDLYEQIPTLKKVV